MHILHDTIVPKQKKNWVEGRPAFDKAIKVLIENKEIGNILKEHSDRDI